MYDFLTFKKFISSDVLILFYYFFAVAVPVALYMFKDKLLKIEPINSIFPQIKELTYDKIDQRYKSWFWALFLFCFLMCELFLRMFFEFLIAYIQIRDVLVGV